MNPLHPDLRPDLRIPILAALTASIFWSLLGCGSGGSTPIINPPPPPPPTPTGATFSGKVFAGTQPIAGASVQIYAAGATGTTSAATPLLSSALTTDTTGAFTIPAGYSCPTTGSQLYVIARGGKVATGAVNSSIALFTAIGTCGQLASSSQFVVNEVTTAAGAWALSQFLSTGGQVNSSATNAQGLANAVATFDSLVNITTGNSPGTAFPSLGVSPAPRINSLANLLNTCSGWIGTAANPCSQLFTSTTVNGAAAPVDTLDAVINLVHHPAANVAALYTQSISSTAFPAPLATAPSDWTLFITLNSIFLDRSTPPHHYPGALGVDSNGSVWVADYFGAVAKFSPTAVPVFPSNITGNNLSDSYGLAIDAKDNVWITNQPESPLPGNSVTVLNSSGQSVAGTTGFTAGGLAFPVGIAIDSNATAWVVDYGNAHVTLLSSSGAALSGPIGYTAPSLAFPVAVAIDANHNGWIADQNDTYVTRISADGKTVLPISCCNSPNSLAIDQLGNVWVDNFQGGSISEIASDGTILSHGFTANGTIDHPQGIAIDGAGSVWIGNFRTHYLTQLAGASTTTPGQPLSPAQGWAPDANLQGSYALAIDASGNIWVTNSLQNSLTEFVGLATPVKTPLLGLPQAP